MSEKYFLYYMMALSISCCIYLVFCKKPAPSPRVYPRDRKFKTPEERQKLFKKLGVRYTPALVFSKPCAVLANLEKGDLYSYPLFRRYYDRLSHCYGPYIATNYMAPVFIQWVNDQVGYGLFADCDLLAEAYIMEYAGEVARHAENATWSWTYPPRDGFWDTKALFAIDAQHCGNEARFANHGDDPNLRVELVYHDKVWHVVYLAARNIEQGEALLIHYGNGYWENRNKIPLQSTVPA